MLTTQDNKPLPVQVQVLLACIVFCLCTLTVTLVVVMRTTAPMLIWGFPLIAAVFSVYVMRQLNDYMTPKTPEVKAPE